MTSFVTAGKTTTISVPKMAQESVPEREPADSASDKQKHARQFPLGITFNAHTSNVQRCLAKIAAPCVCN